MRQEITRRLTIGVFVYGAVVLVVYLAGWLSPRACEELSAVPCLAVAAWYAGAVKFGSGTTIHRWGWLLLTIGWLMIGAAFLLRPGIGRIAALSGAVPTVLGGFGTVWLANWYAPIEEGGTNS